MIAPGATVTLVLIAADDGQDFTLPGCAVRKADKGMAIVHAPSIPSPDARPGGLPSGVPKRRWNLGRVKRGQALGLHVTDALGIQASGVAFTGTARSGYGERLSIEGLEPRPEPAVAT